jgi:hypothetical protein
MAGVMLLLASAAQAQPRLQAPLPNGTLTLDGNTQPLPTPAAGTQAETTAPGVPADATANPDGWRYVWHNNQWWYYTPEKSWLIWNGTAWYPQNDPNAAYGGASYGYGYTPAWSGYYGPGGYNFNYSDGFGSYGTGYVGPGGYGGYGYGPGFSYGWGPGYGWGGGWGGGIGMGIW